MSVEKEFDFIQKVYKIHKADNWLTVGQKINKFWEPGSFLKTFCGCHPAFPKYKIKCDLFAVIKYKAQLRAQPGSRSWALAGENNLDSCNK